MRTAHIIAAVGNHAGRSGFQLLPPRRQRLELPDHALRRRIAVRASFPAHDNVRPAMQDFVARHSIDDLAERWRFSPEVRMDERIGRRNEERYFPALQALTPLEEIGPIGQRWRPVDEEAVGLRKVVERQPRSGPSYRDDRYQRIPPERRAHPCPFVTGPRRAANLHHRRRRSEEHTSELQSLMRITYAV